MEKIRGGAPDCKASLRAGGVVEKILVLQAQAFSRAGDPFALKGHGKPALGKRSVAQGTQGKPVRPEGALVKTAVRAFAKKDFRKKNESAADRGQGMSEAAVVSYYRFAKPQRSAMRLRMEVSRYRGSAVPERNDAAPRAVPPHSFFGKDFWQML